MSYYIKLFLSMQLYQVINTYTHQEIKLGGDMLPSKIMGFKDYIAI